MNGQGVGAARPDAGIQTAHLLVDSLAAGIKERRDTNHEGRPPFHRVANLQMDNRSSLKLAGFIPIYAVKPGRFALRKPVPGWELFRGCGDCGS